MTYSFVTSNGKLMQYPPNITKHRASIEGKLLGCLANDLSLFLNCSGIKSSSMLTDEGKVFFSVLKKVYEKGASNVDLPIIDTVLSDSEILRKEFIKHNGYQAIKNLEKEIVSTNFDTYLSDFSTSNSALETYKLTIELQEKLESMQNVMNQDELSAYVDYKLNEIRKNNVSDTGVQSITISDEYLQGLKEKKRIGTPYDGLRLISNTTRGLHMGNFSLLTASVNLGKSTIMLNMIAMAIVDLGEPVLLYCNESEEYQIQELVLVRTLCTKFEYYGLNRNILAKGEFTSEQEIMIAKARKYIDDNYKDKILFKKANRYSVSEFLSIMRRYAYRGVRHFFLDTYKSENPSSDKVRGELIDSSRRIYETCRALNINCFATYQTAPRHKEVQRRGLDESILSEAKAISEVLDVMLACRQLYDNEYTGEKYDVKPFRYKKKDNGEGYYTEYINLDPTKKYLAISIVKSRYGVKDFVVLYEMNYAWGLLKEVGIATISND